MQQLIIGKHVLVDAQCGSGSKEKLKMTTQMDRFVHDRMPAVADLPQMIYELPGAAISRQAQRRGGTA